jgi:hypothetical protein
MDDRSRPSPVAHGDRFTEAEYEADVSKVIAHAATTGRAVVEAPDGRPRLIITIPTEDLPLLGD